MEHHFTASIRCQWTEWLFTVQSAHVDLLNQIQSKSQLYKYLTIISLWIFLQKSVSPHICSNSNCFVKYKGHNNSTGHNTDEKVLFVLVLTYIWSVDYRLIRINYKKMFLKMSFELSISKFLDSWCQLKRKKFLYGTLYIFLWH